MNDIGVRIARALVKIFGRLPLGFHYAMSRLVCWVVKDVMRYRHDVVMTNLARSFPEKKYRELESIADAYYRHLGDMIVEALWFGASDGERMRKSGILTVMNPEVMNALFESRPSVTVLYSHCGNWELLGGLLASGTATGTPLIVEEGHIKVVYKRLHNAFSDSFFRLNRVSPLERVGTSCEIESSDILRYAVKHKDEKNVYIYMADQYPYQAAYDVGEFLHQPTVAMAGSVRVAQKFSHAVVYLKMKHVSRGRYEASFIPICGDASAMSCDEMMKRYFELLEQEIKETPHNWLWSHKRWK